MLCVFPSKAPCWVVCRKFRQTTFSFKFVYTLSIHLYPHTHEGCDSILQLSPMVDRCFNPHTHEGCDFLLFSAWWLFACFNPHTHEGCDSEQKHLPRPQTAVSIHTPTKGVTLPSWWCIRHRPGFNPHTHEGCDSFGYHVAIRRTRFQSTHPRRVWRRISCFFNSLYKFQSTHPRRVWQFWLEIVQRTFCFNPHTHEGCDI